MAGKSKTALITGITGQDGSYLAELLLSKGYRVHGIVRRASSFNRGRIEHLHDETHGKPSRLELWYGDMTDSANLERIVKEVQPDEIYNLAAQSHVQVSFETPEYTASADAVGTLRLLESIKNSSLIETIRFYQASTSEMYGRVKESPQTETTPFNPQSPYGAAKVYAHEITKVYRAAYGLFACNGILFNHESPRRGENFVSRKVTLTVAGILAGKHDCLYIGNLNASRDWGFAGDYVDAMWRMLQQKKPEDFVIASGITHTVRQFIETAFGHVGVRLRWKGKRKQEVGVDAKTGAVRVRVDPKYFRPLEVDFLLGDFSKAKRKLGWSPKVPFEKLVRMMLEHDLRQNGLRPEEFLLPV